MRHKNLKCSSLIKLNCYFMKCSFLIPLHHLPPLSRYHAFGGHPTMMIVSMWTHGPPLWPHRPFLQCIDGEIDQQFAMVQVRWGDIMQFTVEFRQNWWVCLICYRNNGKSWQWCLCFWPGLSCIKLTSNTWYKRLCYLMGWSSVDLYS